MPRGVKAERPVPAESVEPLQASTVVILHPGSTSLWLGRATDHLPQSIPHVIAWRKPLECPVDLPDQSLLVREGIDHPDSETQRELALSVIEQAIWSRKSSSGSRKNQTTVSQVSTFNAKVGAEMHFDDESSIKWTDTSAKPPIIVGEPALYIHPSDSYTLHWPMKEGRLNLHSGPGGSLTAVCADLENLWAYAIQTHLTIPLRDLGYYRAVLVVPDSFEKNHIKEMMNILLNKLGFSSAIIHQESVSSVFGCGLGAACVVDVGDEKTSVCCIEDGLVIPRSRLWLQYGGRDITRAFFWLLRRVSFPYKECDATNRLDVLLLHELKVTFCHLSEDIVGGQVHEFQVHRPFQTPRSYQLKIGDEALEAPMGMFFPQLFGIVGEKLVCTKDREYDDPEDLYDDRYLLESQRTQDQSSKSSSSKSGPTIESVPDPDQDMTTAIKTGTKQMKLAPDKSLGLDQAILHSINCCTTEDTKRKMYGSVLLIGGGFMFNGAAAMLQSRLQAKLPASHRKLVDQVEVIARPKEMDPRTICWKGAAVLSILDSAQELWITQREWMETISARMISGTMSATYAVAKESSKELQIDLLG
ncbi:actin-related protein 8-like isoform X1 [Acropora palmata]|uniref:actin-related protein 8-like isoform X1 n=1 Tax=Acropora palmata TaxID=6131 RepID=UPI003DA0669F